MKSKYDNFGNVIASRIYMLRVKSFGVTQKEFAKECGISSNIHVCQYEIGAIRPGWKMCQKIVKAAKKRGIDIAIEWLRPDLCK